MHGRGRGAVMLPVLGQGRPCHSHWSQAGADAGHTQVLAALRHLLYRAMRSSVPLHFSQDLASTQPGEGWAW